MQYNEIKRFLINILHTVNSVLPIIFWILLIFGFDEPYEAVITLAAALIHEFGHELFLLIRFGRVGIASGRLAGFRIQKDKTMSYRDEVLLCFCGPLANIAIAIIAIPLMPLGIYAEEFVMINLITAFSNLLPVRGHDGYGILRALLLHFELHRLADSVLDSLSFAIVTLTCLFSLYLMDRLDGGYWFFAIFIFSLLSEIASKLKQRNKEDL